MGGQQCTVVIGFGVVIEAKESPTNEMWTDLIAAELTAYYPFEAGTPNIFVTFEGKVIKFDVNDKYGDFQAITNEKVSPNRTELENFRRTMAKYGVTTDPHLTVYSYND